MNGLSVSLTGHFASLHLFFFILNAFSLEVLKFLGFPKFYSSKADISGA